MAPLKHDAVARGHQSRIPDCNAVVRVEALAVWVRRRELQPDEDRPLAGAGAEDRVAGP